MNLLQKCANTSTDEGVIVRQQHTSHIHFPISRPSPSGEAVNGKETSTVVPLLGDETIFARALTK
jgi:hypothetical protein